MFFGTSQIYKYAFLSANMQESKESDPKAVKHCTRKASLTGCVLEEVTD